MGPDDQPDSILISMTIIGGSGSNTRLTDLTLIPVDEWMGDFLDSDLVGFKIGARSLPASNGYLDIDSVRYPKRQRRALVRYFSGDSIFDIYPWTASNLLSFDQYRDIRFWCMFMRQQNIAGDTDLLALTETVFTATGNKQDRWDFARGNEGV